MDMGDNDDDVPWIQWYCGLRGNEFFCEVSEAFVRDGFNLQGLNTSVNYFEEALDLILDTAEGMCRWKQMPVISGAENTDYAYSEVESEQIQIAAEKLYGLIHARYIITVRGLAQMAEKYQRGDFGQCPRVLCNFAKLAPVAVSDKTDVACVQTYCPSCREIYKPANRKHMSLDGAYFGTSFAHILFMVHPALLPAKITADTKYEPKIFGFRVHKSAGARDS